MTRFDMMLEDYLQGFAGGICYLIRSPAWKNLSWIDELDVKAVEGVSNELDA